MSIESAIEERIKEAMARGDFDGLKGHGKPLDLDAYFNTPEDLRMAYSIVKSNNFVPEEVEIINDIASLQKELETGVDEERKASVTKRLHERRLTLSLLLDKRRRQ